MRETQLPHRHCCVHLPGPGFGGDGLGGVAGGGGVAGSGGLPPARIVKRKESGVNSCLACCVSEPGQPQMLLTYVFVHFRHNLAGRKIYSFLSFLTYFIHNPRDITCDSCEYSVGGRQTSLFAKANSTVQIPRVTLFTHKWTSTIATATS